MSTIHHPDHDLDRLRPTGLAWLDDALGGGLPIGRLTLVLGRPACGKTSLVRSLARHFAEGGQRVTVFDLAGEVLRPGLEFPSSVSFQAAGSLDEILTATAEITDCACLLLDGADLLDHLDGGGSGFENTDRVLPALVRAAMRRSCPLVVTGQLPRAGFDEVFCRNLGVARFEPHAALRLWLYPADLPGTEGLPPLDGGQDCSVVLQIESTERRWHRRGVLVDASGFHLG